MSRDTLSAAFAALADPTRRAILDRLLRGDASVAELAEPFAMTTRAISKHVAVLAAAGLVTRGRDAQRRPSRIRAEPLVDIDAWLHSYRRLWPDRFDRPDEHSAGNVDAPASARLRTVVEMKTPRNDDDVARFLAGVADPKRRADAEALCALMAEATGVGPAMWGTGIVGFGSYRYRYASGREGEAPAVGMSPRKQNLTIYIYAGLDGNADLLNLLGPHSLGKGCLYLRRLSDVDEGVLRRIVGASFTHLNGRTITPDIG